MVSDLSVMWHCYKYAASVRFCESNSPRIHPHIVTQIFFWNMENLGSIGTTVSTCIKHLNIAINRWYSAKTGMLSSWKEIMTNNKIMKWHVTSSGCLLIARHEHPNVFSCISFGGFSCRKMTQLRTNVSNSHPADVHSFTVQERGNSPYWRWCDLHISMVVTALITIVYTRLVSV